MNFLLSSEFAARIGLDLVMVAAILGGVYLPRYRRSDLLLTFVGFNLAIASLGFVLNQSGMSLGAAFGLFGAFSMLRYRTEGISPRDMTYLFLVIAMGLMAGVGPGDWRDQAVGSAVLVFAAAAVEYGVGGARETGSVVVYDRTHLAAADRAGLIAELSKRTGLAITRIEIQEIDLSRETTHLTVFYRP